MRVSIITIALNNPAGLRGTIESVLPLERILGSELEHIIVDSSPMAHAEVREMYQSKSHIDWVVTPPRGIYSAINDGTQKSQGKIVWHLHSGDEIFDPETAAAALLRLETSSAKLLFSDVRLMRDQNFIFIHRHHPEVRKNLLGCCSVHHQGVLFRREVFERIGWFNLKYQLASDYEFFIRIANARLPAIHSSIPFVNYDTGGRSLTNWQTVFGESLKIMRTLESSPYEQMCSIAIWLYHYVRLAVFSPLLRRFKIYNISRKLFYKLKNKSNGRV